MLYYKVKKEADQKRRKDGTIYIANELYTQKETEKLQLNINFMELVNVNKNSTYFFFGARFEEVNA
jgi:hypothetical protein